MQESDFKHFERAMNRLCAGFNVPLTDSRRDAYWRSFRRIEVLEFAGLIDMALVEASYTTLPTVGALRELLNKNSSPEPELPQSGRAGPSIQEQLCEYAAQHVHDLAGPKEGMTLWEYSRPWTYVYREWMDGHRRCAECIGLVIELKSGKKIGWSVNAMRADQEGHAKALKAFTPGPKPTDAQRAALSGLGDTSSPDKPSTAQRAEA